MNGIHYNAVIISEVSGKVEFNDITNKVFHLELKSDEQTGYQEKVIIDSRNKKISPSITIGDTNIYYSVPVGAHLAIDRW